LPESLLPWILAFFSGFFIYVGASDLLPEARENDSPLIGVATVVGMLLVFLVSRVLPR
jgi:zinc transporter ZupT